MTDSSTQHPSDPVVKRFLPKSTFARQVLTLISGTGLAQALPVVAAPILTRLYTPAEYGVFSLFVALTAILSVLGTGRYELAILLPPDDTDAANLTAVTIGSSLVVSAVMFFAVLFFGGSIAIAFGNPAAAPWLYFVPVTVFAMGVYRALNFWFNRQQQYRRLALNRVNRSGLTVLAMLGLGVQRWVSGGMILGTVIGQVCASGVFVGQTLRENRTQRARVSWPGMRRMARRYRDFPIYSVPADMINALSAQLPLLVLAMFFGPVYAGYFGLTQRVLGGPLGMVSNAFADVFKQRASRDFNVHGNCRSIWLRTFKHLVLLSLAPSVVVAMAAPVLFAFAFGTQWRESGRMAQLMTPYFLLAFTVSPLSRTLLVAEKQRHNLAWQAVLALLTGTSLLVGAKLKQPMFAIGLYSAGYSAMYVLYLWMSYRYSAGEGTRSAGVPSELAL